MRKLLPFALPLLLCVGFVVAQTGRVGPLPSLDGSNVNYRQERTGALVIASLGDVNRERVRRGQCYYAAQQGAGTAPGTTLSTTAELVAYNPQNSGVLICVKRVWNQYFSGTLGTGTTYHCINQSVTQTAPSGGTLLANSPALAGAANTSVCQVRIGATVVQPIIIAPFAYLPPELATSVTPPQQSVDDLEDSVQLLPGTSYQLQAVAAAGTSPLMAPGIFWEEIPLLNAQP